MAKKKKTTSKIDPWSGAAHSTGGLGSTAALKAAAARVAPPAAPASVSSPTPNIESDTAYQAKVAAINKARQDALTSLSGLEGTTKRNYGIEDTSDPYSRAALLQQALQRNKEGTTNGMAARGQLYSGALQNAQTANQQSYNENYDSLSKAYQEALSAFKRQRQEIETGSESQIGDAQADALNRAIASRPPASDIADGVPVTSAASTGGSVPANAPRPKRGFAFVQDSGPRAGKSYNVVTKGGKKYRLYDGETTPVLA